MRGLRTMKQSIEYLASSAKTHGAVNSCVPAGQIETFSAFHVSTGANGNRLRWDPDNVASSGSPGILHQCYRM